MLTELASPFMRLGPSLERDLLTAVPAPGVCSTCRCDTADADRKGYCAGSEGSAAYLAEGQGAQRHSATGSANELSHKNQRPQRPRQRSATGRPDGQAAPASAKPYMPHLLPKATVK